MPLKRLITYKGETKRLAEWSRITKLPSNIIQSRIFRYGWTVEDALETPIGSYPSRINLNRSNLTEI